MHVCIYKQNESKLVDMTFNTVKRKNFRFVRILRFFEIEKTEEIILFAVYFVPESIGI